MSYWTAHKLRKAYTRLAPRYEYLAQKASYHAHKIMGTWTIRTYKKRSAKVLDIGCGTGLSSLLFFKKGYTVTGIDIAPGMIREASKLPFKQLLCQNVESSLRVKNNSFDIIVLFSVLELINNPLLLFKQVHKKLKKNGVFAVTVPKKLPKSSRMPIHTYTQKEAEKFFSEAGFSVVGYRRMFGYKDRHSNYNKTIHYIGYLLRKN